jgi:hypothetical protein
MEVNGQLPTCHFTLRGLGSSPQCSQDRRLGRPEASQDAVEERSLFLLQEIYSFVVQLIA